MNKSRMLAAALALLAVVPAARAAEPESAPAAQRPRKARRAKAPPQSVPLATPAQERPEAGFDQFEDEFGGKGQGPAVKTSDPLRGYNRVMFAVNDKLYFWLFKPLAVGYGFILPEVVRVSIARAYDNLGFPVRFVNSGFQGKFGGAGRELARFVTNSTLGVGGLFDPADRWFHLDPSDEDFGQTFGFYGVGTGFPIVLPLLGQTNLRDGIGLVPNTFLNPVYYVTEPEIYLAVTAGGHFNKLSLHIGDYEKIKKDSLDPYTFIRDAHLQNREEKVKE